MDRREIRAAAKELKANRHQYRVSKLRPCPICGKDDWCLASDAVALCPRIEDGAVWKDGQYGWLHLIGETYIPGPPPKPDRKRTDAELDRELRQYHCSLAADDKIKELADALGVSPLSLRNLAVWYGECGGRLCWTFPCRNAVGQVVGIQRRLVTPVDGKNKLHMPRTRPGLYYGLFWDLFDGPLYLVEGETDTAAGLTMGLSVIGRPNNTGGVRPLTEMLTDYEGDIVVVAERDRKRHDDLAEATRKRHKRSCGGCQLCWPGKYGAVTTAMALARGLRRPVGWMFPPDGAKDMRAWLCAQKHKDYGLGDIWRKVRWVTVAPRGGRSHGPSPKTRGGSSPGQK